MLILPGDVGFIFNQKIKKTLSSKPEIFNFINNHDRKQMVIDNLSKMIRETEWTRPDLMTGQVRISFIEDSAKMFIEAALESKKQELMTQGARDVLVRSADKYKRAQEMLDDINKEDALDGTSFFVTK